MINHKFLKEATTTMEELHKDSLIKSLLEEIAINRDTLSKVIMLSTSIMVFEFIAIVFLLIRNYI